MAAVSSKHRSTDRLRHTDRCDTRLRSHFTVLLQEQRFVRDYFIGH